MVAGLNFFGMMCNSLLESQNSAEDRREILPLTR